MLAHRRLPSIASPRRRASSYTLEQILTVSACQRAQTERSTFFGSNRPCTLAVTSKDSGDVELNIDFARYDTLTLTVTST